MKTLQESLFDEGLRIAQQYGMADFAEEIKGLIKHENTDGRHDIQQKKTIDNSDPKEINGNCREESNSCDSRDSQSGDNNNHETEGTSSQEQDRLIENSSEKEKGIEEEESVKSRSSRVHVFNILPLSESEENNTDLEESRTRVTCS